VTLSDDDRAWILPLNHGRMLVAFGAPTMSLLLGVGPLAWTFSWFSPFSAWDARLAVSFVLALITLPAVIISIAIERVHRAMLVRRGLDPALYLPVWREASSASADRALRAMATPSGPLAVGFVLGVLFGTAAVTSWALQGRSEVVYLLATLAVLPLPTAAVFVGARELVRRADVPVPRLATDGLCVHCPACAALRTFPPSAADARLVCPCGHRFLVPALPVALHGSAGLRGLALWCASSPVPTLLVVGRTPASLKPLAAERVATVIVARGAEATWLRTRLSLPRGPALVLALGGAERGRLVGDAAKTATAIPNTDVERPLDLTPRPAWSDARWVRAAHNLLFYPKLLAPILAGVATKMAFEDLLSEGGNLAVSLLLTAAIVAWIITAHALRGPLVGEPRQGLAWYFGAPPAD
jgi:hypothetical protein